MGKRKWEKLVFTSMFTALTCIATMVIQIPSPMNGYLNLGDAAVLLGAWILGPAYGAFAGGVGSMLADLLSGYVYYAPGTLVIKGVVALVALPWSFGHFGASLIKGGWRRSFRESWVSVLWSQATLAMPVYFCRRGLAAAASIPGNLVQGGVGIAAATAVYLALRQVAQLPGLLRGD